MFTWSIEEKRLNLKYNWKISRNSSTCKINFFISVTDGQSTGIGEVAPNIRYGESPDLINEAFARFLKSSNQIRKLEDLEVYLINLPNALRFGIESAFIHLQAQRQNLPVSSFLKLPQPGPVYTSYTLPIMDIAEISGFISTHNLNRFQYLKLKVNAENAVDLTKELAKHTSRLILVDANEAFSDPDQVMHYLEAVGNIPLGFLEQPFPSSKKTEYKFLKKITPVKLFADESVTDKPDLNEVSEQFHGINVKLMKSGGYLNAIATLQEAKSIGLNTMIGCMIETSLGISSALNLASLCDYADLDGTFVLEKDPFNLIKEQTGALFLGY